MRCAPKIRPVEMQVDDLLDEVRKVAADGFRVLCTVLTKRMAEDLTEYMHEQGIRVRYMHSDIDTLERIEILRDLRLGAFDVLIGINLLREGLDIPECGLVAILDADKSKRTWMMCSKVSSRPIQINPASPPRSTESPLWALTCKLI